MGSHRLMPSSEGDKEMDRVQGLSMNNISFSEEEMLSEEGMGSQTMKHQHCQSMIIEGGGLLRMLGMSHVWKSLVRW
jgi:hypothetical protein